MDIRLPVSPTRFLIVHYHIFKNGGSTVASILEREFQNAFATVHGPDDVSVLDLRIFANLFSTIPPSRRSRAIIFAIPSRSCPTQSSSTGVFCGIHWTACSRCILIFSGSILPIRYAGWLGRSNPRSFFKKLIESAPHLVSNVQVTFLAQGGAFTRPADTSDVEAAADIFAKMAIPGIGGEVRSKSLVAAEYFLKPAFPRLRLDYGPQNVSRPLGANSVDRQEWLRHSWGSDLFATLVQLNQCDLELSGEAEDEVARRFSLVPAAEQCLKNFRSRCPQSRIAADYAREYIA